VDLTVPKVANGDSTQDLVFCISSSTTYPHWPTSLTRNRHHPINRLLNREIREETLRNYNVVYIDRETFNQKDVIYLRSDRDILDVFLGLVKDPRYPNKLDEQVSGGLEFIEGLEAESISWQSFLGRIGFAEYTEQF
jgi:hypothetical protein